MVAVAAAADSCKRGSSKDRTLTELQLPSCSSVRRPVGDALCLSDSVRCGALAPRQPPLILNGEASGAEGAEGSE